MGVPADKWMQVRSDYIDQRKHGKTQQTTPQQQDNVVQKSERLVWRRHCTCYRRRNMTIV